MKVSGTGSTSSLGGPRRAGRSDRRSDDFASHLDALEGPGEPQPVDSLAPLSAVDALLAAQSIGDALDGEGRKRTLQRGEDILDQLDQIRVGLLLGNIPRERLEQLARLIASRRDEVADPGLAALMDEIELRAQVELAKLGQT